MKTITRNIPNAITSLNLLAGCISIVFSSLGNLQVAGYLIFAAAICDFFDGFAARLLKVNSPIGLQLDSLADVVSFGVAPSMMLFYNNLYSNLFSNSINWLIVGSPFLIAIFSAVRLAKFNIDTRQTDSFIGLPTPACALLIASALIFNNNEASFIINKYFILCMSLILSYLLISEIPMFSLKVKKQENWNLFFQKYKIQVIFLLLSIVFIFIFKFGGIAISMLLYIIISIINWIFNRETVY